MLKSELEKRWELGCGEEVVPVSERTSKEILYDYIKNPFQHEEELRYDFFEYSRWADLPGVRGWGYDPYDNPIDDDCFKKIKKLFDVYESPEDLIVTFSVYREPLELRIASFIICLAVQLKSKVCPANKHGKLILFSTTERFYLRDLCEHTAIFWDDNMRISNRRIATITRKYREKLLENYGLDSFYLDKRSEHFDKDKIPFPSKGCKSNTKRKL